MQKTVRRPGDWSNRATKELYYKIEADEKLFKHVKSRTRTAQKLWTNADKAGVHTAVARKRAACWLALRLRDELAAISTPAPVVPRLSGEEFEKIAWLDIAEELFFGFDPTESCWPR